MRNKIVFKSVGQGDTIIVETLIQDTLHIGIIDCIKYNSSNPVVNYFEGLQKAKKKFIIEFVAVSHPHEDHYNGMKDLMNYFSSKPIPIIVKRFYHTYWYKYTISAAGEIITKITNHKVPKGYAAMLEKFVNTLEELKTAGIIRNISELSDGSILRFPLPLQFICFSPSLEEKKTFLDALIKRTKKNRNGKPTIPKTNDFANLHSSVILIKGQQTNKSVLLTSDSLDATFERLQNDTDFWEDVSGILAGQIPHHGSKENFVEKFWKKLIDESPKLHAVISVGSNTYKHPNIEVIKKLIKLGITKIMITDRLKGNYTAKANASDKARKNSHSIDYVSKICANTRDIEYTI